MDKDPSYLDSLITRRRSIRLYTVMLSLLGFIIGLITMKSPKESKYVGGGVGSKTSSISFTVSKRQNYLAGVFCFLGSFAILTGGHCYHRRLTREIELEQKFMREQSD